MARTREPSEAFLAQVTAWAAAQRDIVAVALVGSHARGTARPGSDVDLVILTATPERFLADTAWPARFGRVDRHRIEPGAV
jgi:predicted nucleotidyltransferase